MKYALIQVSVLVAAVAVTVACAYGAVRSRWAAAGVESLYVAAAICLLAALVAAVPVGVVATHWRAYVPQAAFAGTAIRLLGTGALGVAYCVFGSVHQTSFLVCLVALYLVLLVVETGLIVCIVPRALRGQAHKGE